MLGGWDYWGAEQYRQNILTNAGFEPIIEGRILEVASPTSTTFEDDVNWIGKGPSNWYKGATFSVRSGVSAGATGQISAYNPNGSGDPIFTCNGSCPTLNTGDEISMYFTDPVQAGNIPNWWTSDTAFVQTNSDHEPNSKGTYSLQTTLNGSDHRIDSYFDSIGNKTINFLPVSGQWQFSFWAKTVNASSDAAISVDFSRLSDGTHGNTDFISPQTFKPTGTWQQYTYTFTGNETANLGPLDFEVDFNGTSGTILVDDVFLGSTSGSPGGWRNEVVNTLNTLRPGTLRDWQGQLGEPFLYRTGDDTAHGGTSYDGPAISSELYSYTMGDFFALAHTVGAEPWVVLPTTVTDAELQQYGAYLEQQQALYHFPEIMIELGNENWNGVFRGAGIISASSYAAVAQRDFSMLQEAANNDSTLKFVGAGQYASPYQIQQVAEGIPVAPYIAAAPYFFVCQDTGLAVSTYLNEMFNDGFSIPSNEMIPIAQGLQPGQTAVTYEENLSTDGGSATTAERDEIVGGYGSGGALAQQILRLMNSGFRIQNAFVLAQLNFDAQDGAWGYSGQCANNPPSGTTVPIWGIVHDLNAASNLIRPTGLAVELANMAVGGDFYPVNTSKYPGVTGAAFLSSGKWSALFSNGNATSQTITLTFPSGTVPTSMSQLAYTNGLTDTNESSALVSIKPGSVTSLGNNQVSFVIPPWGAVALTP